MPHLRRAALGPTNGWDWLPTVLAVQLSVALLALVLYHGFWFSVGRTDFRSFWATAQLVRAGIDPYNLAAQQEIQQALGMEFVPFLNPPWFLFLVLPFTMLPLPWAARAWFLANLVGLGLVGFLLVRLAPRDARFSWRELFYGSLATLALLIPTLKFLGSGQSTLFGFLFPFLLALYGMERGSARLAGMGLALATTKPNLGILVIPAALWWLSRRSAWRSIAWFIAGSGIIFTLSTLLLGLHWPLSYLLFLQESPLPRLGDLRNGSLLNLLYLILGQSWFLQTLYGGIAALLAAPALSLWYRDAKSAPSMTNLLLLRVGLLMATTLLVTPYLQDYDYILLLVPVVAALAAQQDVPRLWGALLSLSLLLTGVLYLVLWMSPLNWVSLIYVWAPALWYVVTILAPGTFPATRATGTKLR